MPLLDYANSCRISKSRDSPLYDACSRGGVEEVRRRVQLDRRVDTPFWWGDTPLHVAANHGNLEVVKELLRLGADAALLGSTGGTALHLAAGRGYTYVCAVLCAAIDVDAPSRNGCTPLLSAVTGTAQRDTISLLLEKGAKPGKANDNGASPISASVGNPGLFRLLFDRLGLAAVLKLHPWILRKAINSNDYATARFLLREGAPWRVPSDPACYLILYTNNRAVASALVQAGSPTRREAELLYLKHGGRALCLTPPYARGDADDPPAYLRRLHAALDAHRFAWDSRRLPPEMLLRVFATSHGFPEAYLRWAAATLARWPDG